MIPFVSMEVFAGSPGSKGAVFLKLGQGARANAMGESFVAVADDINALYWNPAGIANIKEHQFTFMYSDWLAEIKYNYLAYVHPAQILGGIMGGAVTLLNSGDIDGRDKNQIPTGNFEGKDIALSVSYAKAMMENGNEASLSLGATLKYIQMKMADKDSTGFAVDIGCLYQPPVKNLTLGANIQNIGPKLSAFESEKIPLPRNIKAGAAYRLLNDALTMSLDVNFPSDNDTNFNFGTEYWFKELIAIRAGYKTLTKDELKSSNLTYGAGFNLPWPGIGINYAFGDYDELGDTHRVSVLIGGSGRERLVPKIKGEQTPTKKDVLTKNEPSSQSNLNSLIQKKEHILEVIVRDTHVWTGPGIQYPLLASLNEKTQLILLDDSDKWNYKVKLEDGNIGWICSLYVTRID